MSMYRCNLRVPESRELAERVRADFQSARYVDASLPRRLVPRLSAEIAGLPSAFVLFSAALQAGGPSP